MAAEAVPAMNDNRDIYHYVLRFAIVAIVAIDAVWLLVGYVSYDLTHGDGPAAAVALLLAATWRTGDMLGRRAQRARQATAARRATEYRRCRALAIEHKLWWIDPDGSYVIGEVTIK